MSNYNPQWAHPPQQNQPQPPKKSNFGKVLGIIGIAVAAALVLVIALALQSGTPSAPPTVTVTETAKPEPAPTVTVTAKPKPTKTVTAKAKPAPTVTVTQRPNSDEPATPQESPTGTAEQIASENANCNWSPQSEGDFTIYGSDWCHGVIVAVPANQDPTTVAYILAAELDETDGWYMVIGSDYIYYTPDSDDAHYVSNSYGGDIYTDDI